MKKLVLITAIISASFLPFKAAHAKTGDSVLAVECTLDDQYIGLDSIKYIPIDNSYAPISVRGGRVYISYSETECEDSTNLTFELADFKKLENGETAYAEIEHAGVDLQVTGTVRCKKVALRE